MWPTTKFTKNEILKNETLRKLEFLIFKIFEILKNIEISMLGIANMFFK